MNGIMLLFTKLSPALAYSDYRAGVVRPPKADRELMKNPDDLENVAPLPRIE